MKFGSQLKGSLYREWAEYYLDYDGLKKHLKRGEKQERGYTEKDESDFVEKLDKELVKIYNFRLAKYEEIQERVQNCEKAVASINKSPPMNVPDRYAEVEREINAITEELNELAKYARLNYTGIIKIVKKHDRRTRYILRPMFNVRLNAKPFYKETYEPIIVQLSRLYHIVHTGLGIDQMSSQISSTPSFSFSSSWHPPHTERISRHSYKFWVHPNNIMEVRTTILRHLPVLIYKTSSDSSITSVYFDNQSFELYQDKIDHKDGEQLIRLRWYGSKEHAKKIFVERKVRQQGEQEIKDRFMVKDKNMSAFLNGTWSLEKRIEKMREIPGKSEQDIERFKEFVADVQTMIKRKDLEPVLCSHYNRMAFQIPGDGHVRITLDTNLVLLREDNFDTIRRPEDKWHRPDMDEENYPFNKLPASDIVRFPYAVLEVKLNLEAGEREPAWVMELMKSHLVEEAPQFSKYVHGIATLFTSQAPSLPFWLPNIDKDILKPPNDRTTSYDSDDDETPSTSTSKPLNIQPQARSRHVPSRNAKPIYVEVVGDNSQRKRKKKDKGKAVAYSPSSEDEPYQESTHLNDRVSSSSPLSLDTIRRLFTKSQRRSPSPVKLPPGISPPKKSKEAPRVEPKVYLANERTFFAWLRFSVLLGTFALALFNAGGEEPIGRLCGLLYSLISVSVLFYALIRFHQRTVMIKSSYGGPYDDLVTPTLVCGSLFVAVGLNFWLKLGPKMVEGQN